MMRFKIWAMSSVLGRDQMAKILAQNLLAIATASITATTSQGGSFPQNIADGNLFDYWQPAATGLQVLTVDFGVDCEVNAIGLAGDTLFSSGITSVEVRQYDSGDVLLSTDNLILESDAVKRFDLTENINTRSVQIQFNVISELPRIASLYIGKMLISIRAPAFGTELPWLDNNAKASTVRSQVGIVLGKIVEVPEGITMSIQLNYLPKTWVRNEWVPFVKSAIDTPFFIQLSDSVPDVVYAMSDSVELPKFVDPNYCSVTLKFSGILE